MIRTSEPSFPRRVSLLAAVAGALLVAAPGVACAADTSGGDGLVDARNASETGEAGEAAPEEPWTPPTADVASSDNSLASGFREEAERRRQVADDLRDSKQQVTDTVEDGRANATAAQASAVAGVIESTADGVLGVAAVSDTPAGEVAKGYRPVKDAINAERAASDDESATAAVEAGKGLADAATYVTGKESALTQIAGAAEVADSLNEGEYGKAATAAAGAFGGDVGAIGEALVDAADRIGENVERYEEATETKETIEAQGHAAVSSIDREEHDLRARADSYEETARALEGAASRSSGSTTFEPVDDDGANDDQTVDTTDVTADDVSDGPSVAPPSSRGATDWELRSRAEAKPSPRQSPPREELPPSYVPPSASCSAGRPCADAAR